LQAAKEREAAAKSQQPQQPAPRETPVPAARTSLIANSGDSSESFLRQKEAQLKEKREKEKQKEQDTAKNNHRAPSATSDNNVKKEIKEPKIVKRTKEPSKPSSAPLVQNVPEFYFPAGRPNVQTNESVHLQKIKDEFAKVEGGKLDKNQMAGVCKVSWMIIMVLFGVMQLDHITCLVFFCFSLEIRSYIIVYVIGTCI
jgi:hypothetical protein